MVPSTGGSVLALVLSILLIIELVVGGLLALTFSSRHAQVAAGQAMEAAQVAEAGLHYAVAQLVTRASAAPLTDEAYAGDAVDMPLTDASGTVRGMFRVTVACTQTHVVPPDCGTLSGRDESDWRRIVSEGFVPTRPGPGRRVIEATIRRFRPQGSDTPLFGVCGRDGVELDGAAVTADVGSDGDIRLGRLSEVRRRTPTAPTASGSVQPLAAMPRSSGLTGMYSWRVTYLDYRGRESTGGPPTVPVRLQREYARLTALPVGPTSITRRRIYRTLADQASKGPWYFVGEIPDNTTREYSDTQADATLRIQVKGPIAGNVVAAGVLTCVEDCRAQVDGTARSRSRGVSCPAFLTPPCTPGAGQAPSLIVQDRRYQEMRWGPLHVGSRKIVTVVTPGDSEARLHIHLTDIDMAKDSALIVFGRGTVYFHVQGPVHLAERAMLGVEGGYPVGALIRPADRVQILSCAQDAPHHAFETATASMRFDAENRVSALLFAPDAAITVHSAAAFRGAVFGRHVQIVGVPADATPSDIAPIGFFRGMPRGQLRSEGAGDQWGGGIAATRILLDHSAILGSPSSGARPSPFQYLVRWNDLSDSQLSKPSTP